MKLYKTETPVEYNEEKDIEHFFVGLLFSVDENTALNYSKNKTFLELGKTCGFAIRTRGALRTSKHFGFGVDALKKDQYYFGNNPNEKISGKPVPFMM